MSDLPIIYSHDYCIVYASDTLDRVFINVQHGGKNHGPNDHLMVSDFSYRGVILRNISELKRAVIAAYGETAISPQNITPLYVNWGNSAFTYVVYQTKEETLYQQQL